MRSSKPYTNEAFTHRPDHSAGLHRGPRAPRERLVCRHCGAVYLRRRWIAGTDPRAALAGAGATPTLCRACDMAAKGLAGGYLKLEGSFFVAHRKEIEHLLQNEVEREVEDNPLGKILRWDAGVADVLTVATSTEHLAARLGHAVHKAFKGKVHYGFSHENKFAHVTWRRDG
jgi:hypothetical protein